MLYSARLLITMRQTCVVIDIRWLIITIIIIIIITSAKEDMFLPLLVCLAYLFCLSVNIFTRKLLIRSSWIFFTTDVSLDKDISIKFWKSSGSGSGSGSRSWNFEGIFTIAGYGNSETFADNSRRSRQINHSISVLIYRSRRGSRNFFTEFSCHCGIGAIISFFASNSRNNDITRKVSSLGRGLRFPNAPVNWFENLDFLLLVISIGCGTWNAHHGWLHLVANSKWLLGTRCIIAYHFLCTVDSHIFRIYRILILTYRPINAVQDTRIIGRVSYWQAGPWRLRSCQAKTI